MYCTLLLYQAVVIKLLKDSHLFLCKLGSFDEKMYRSGGIFAAGVPGKNFFDNLVLLIVNSADLHPLPQWRGQLRLGREESYDPILAVVIGEAGYDLQMDRVAHNGWRYLKTAFNILPCGRSAPRRIPPEKWRSTPIRNFFARNNKSRAAGHGDHERLGIAFLAALAIGNRNVDPFSSFTTGRNTQIVA